MIFSEDFRGGHSVGRTGVLYTMRGTTISRLGSESENIFRGITVDKVRLWIRKKFMKSAINLKNDLNRHHDEGGNMVTTSGNMKYFIAISIGL